MRRLLAAPLPGRAFLLVVLVVLALPAPASAKLSLEFDRATARPGDRVYLRFGDYFTSAENVVNVYLVHAPILGDVITPTHGGGVRRLGPPPRLSGVYKVGRTLSGNPGLRFRLPNVRAGRYAAVIWCSTCQNRYLLANFQGGIPDDASVRDTRGLLRVVR